MKRASRHPKSGQTIRIDIDDGNLQAGFDLMIQGQPAEVIDWAERIIPGIDADEKEFKSALACYAHRCIPDVPAPVSGRYSVSFPLDDLVLVSACISHDGMSSRCLVLLRAGELEEF